MRVYPARVPRPDAFRAWLRGRGSLRKTARDLNLTHPAVALWNNGGGVAQDHHAAVKKLAKSEGVILTTDHLLRVP